MPAAAATATLTSGFSAVLVRPRLVNSLSTAATINSLMSGLRATIPLSQANVLKVEKFAVESTSTLTFCPKAVAVLNKRTVTEMINSFTFKLRFGFQPQSQTLRAGIRSVLSGYPGEFRDSRAGQIRAAA